MEIKCTPNELNELIGKEPCKSKTQAATHTHSIWHDQEFRKAFPNGGPISDGADGTYIGTVGVNCDSEGNPIKKIAEEDKKLTSDNMQNLHSVERKDVQPSTLVNDDKLERNCVHPSSYLCKNQ